MHLHEYFETETLFKDAHNLNDKELENYIKDLIANAHHHATGEAKNSSSTLFLLLIAASEKSNRASKRIAHVAIFIAVFSAGLSAVAILV